MPSSMPGTLRRSRQRRNKRMMGVNRPQPTAGISILSAVKGTNTIAVTFDQSVILTGTPQYTLTGNAALPESADLTTPSEVTLNYAVPLSAVTALNVPYEEPAVRNSGGGFVSTSQIDIT